VCLGLPYGLFPSGFQKNCYLINGKHKKRSGTSEIYFANTQNKLKYTWTTPWEEIGTAPGGLCSVPIFGKYGSFSGFGQQ
jgi:hypothetical protein